MCQSPMRNIINNLLNLLIGVLYITTVILGYYNGFSHMSEYCFISGMSVGCIFLFAAFYGCIKHKKIPGALYLDGMIAVLLILIATVSIRLNLEGAFWFIHVINPIIVFVYFLVYCDCREIKKPKLVLTSLIFPIAYILFAFCLWKISGQCPFPANLILRWDNPIMPFVIMIGLSLIILILSYSVFYFNRFIFNKRSEKGC